MHISFGSKKQIILLIIIALTLSFIFGQSSLNIEESIRQSDKFEETLNNIFSPPIDTIVDDNKNDGDISDITDDTLTGNPSDDDNTPGGDTSGGDTPGGDTSGGDTPGGDTSGGDNTDTPGGDTPGGDNTDPPGGDTPGGDNTDTPGGDTPGGDNTDTPDEENPDNSDEGSEEDEEPEIIVIRKKSPFMDYIRPHIRKIAHFMEHGILGLEVFFFLLCVEKDSGKKRKILPIGIKTIFMSLNFGILVAFIDESIQMFSDRGPTILDAWIDISGYTTFTALLTIIYIIVKSIKYFVTMIPKAKSN